MLPDRVSNPGPLTYESGALPVALRGPAWTKWEGPLSRTKKKRINSSKVKDNGNAVQII